MKIFKIKLGLLSLLAVLAVSVFLTSCEQDALDIPDVVESEVDALAFTHDKDIEILSENGLSKVTITASANDVSLLDEIKQGDFKIIPVFEQPAEDLNQITDDGTSNISEDAEISDRGIPVAFTVNNVELEEGAIGYTIEVNQTDLSRSSGYAFWYSSKNNVRLNRYRGCIRLEVWRQLYSNSSFQYKLNSNSCSRNTTSYYGGNSHRLKAKVSYGSNYSYWITFF